jgi:hypothetical protein
MEIRDTRCVAHLARGRSEANVVEHDGRVVPYDTIMNKLRAARKMA